MRLSQQLWCVEISTAVRLVSAPGAEPGAVRHLTPDPCVGRLVSPTRCLEGVRPFLSRNQGDSYLVGDCSRHQADAPLSQTSEHLPIPVAHAAPGFRPDLPECTRYEGLSQCTRNAPGLRKWLMPNSGGQNRGEVLAPESSRQEATFRYDIRTRGAIPAALNRVQAIDGSSPSAPAIRDYAGAADPVPRFDGHIHEATLSPATIRARQIVTLLCGLSSE